MVSLFRIIAFLEGISYLALFANMLFLKPNNPELYQTFLFPVGMAHGMLFILYIALAFLVKSILKWDTKTLLIVLLASVVPFGTFYIEKKYLKK